MLIFIIILLVIFVPVTVLKLNTYTLDAPHPFACGSDEVCYCSKATYCKKRESKEVKEV